MLRVARHLFGITSASNNIGGVNCITNQIRDYKKRTIKIRTRTRPKKVYNGKQLRRKEQPLEANNTYMLQRLQIMRQKRTYKEAVRMFDYVVLKKKAHPNLFVWRSMLYTIGYRAKQIDEAMRIFDYMRKHYPIKDRYSYNIMIHAYAIRGDYKKAIELWNEMQDIGMEPNSFTFCYLLKSFIKLAKRGEEEISEEVKNLIEGIKHTIELNENIMNNKHVQDALQEINKYMNQ